MAAADIAELLKRSDRAWDHKRNWDELYADVYDLFMPQRQLFREHRPGQQKNDRAFDSAPINALVNSANRMQHDLTPPGQHWAMLRAGPGIPPDQEQEVNDQLHKITRQLFAALESSNWDNANSEVLHDLLVGTGAMLILEGPDLETPVRFVPVPIAQLALEEGPWGTVSAVFRKHKVAVRNITGQWPDAELPDQLEKMRDESPDTEVELQEVTYEGDSDEQSNRPWYYDVLWKAGGDQGPSGERLVSRRYRRNPWVTPRWVKLPGETYGRGPAIQALPDARTLNKMKELVLKNAALQIHGVYTVTDQVNPANVRIQPGATIPVTSNGGARGPDIQPLAIPGNFELGQIEEEKLVNRIKQALLDDGLPPETGAVRSATEIVERVKQLAQDIGAPFGRIVSEYLTPAIQRTLDIMENKGLIQPVSINGLTVQVRVQSKLAQEQNLNDVEAVTRWMTLLSSFGQEALILAAQIERIGPWLGERLGVPNDLIRDREQQKVLQQLADQLAQQQVAQGGTGGQVPTAAPQSAEAIQTGAAAGGVPTAA